MKIAIVHDGPTDHSLILTSIVSGLIKRYGQYLITWISSRDNSEYIKHMPCVRFKDIESSTDNEEYDIILNYGGSELANLKAFEIKARSYFGSSLFGNHPTAFMENQKSGDLGYQALYSGRVTSQNLFQIFYSMAGMSWKGESYGFTYYPKNRMKKGCVGVAIQDSTINGYLQKNLEVTENRLWLIPIKKNILKQFDEVNRCDSLITDCPIVMQSGVYLRKRVEFLAYQKPNVRFEFFGNGAIHFVPENIKSLVLGIKSK
jgi:hypothetical protein